LLPLGTSFLAVALGVIFQRPWSHTATASVQGLATPTGIHLSGAAPDDPRYRDIILVAEHSERFALVAGQTDREPGT